MSELKQRLLRELKEAVKTEKEQLKELQDTAEFNTFAKTTVTGGAFSGAARDACEGRAKEAEGKIRVIENDIKWQELMISKYEKTV